jgi:hypothetical protein
MLGRRKPRVAAPKEIIHGITLDVRGRDLAERIGARIEWHRMREAAVRAQLQQLTDTDRGDRGAAIAVSQRESLRLGLERRLSDHQQRVEFLSFLRDHLSPQRIYRLDSLDFRMIEIMPDTGGGS